MTEDRTSIDIQQTKFFLMPGAREILVIATGATNIERTITALESSVIENPAFAFDLAKALVEAVCKTILADRGKPVQGTPDLPGLLKDTTKELQITPDSHADNSEVKKSLQKIINGLSTTIQGLCELRRSQGMASHGRDGYEKSLESLQAMLVARAADAIVHYLYHAHRSYPSSNPVRRIEYSENSNFNDYINNYNELIKIFEFTYEPSDILFTVDRKAYRELLEEFTEKENSEESN